jgi:hypothetical protein
MSTKLMHGKGKTPHGRVNPAAKQFDLARVAQTKKYRTTKNFPVT